MPVTEHTINDALAEVLATTRSLWHSKGVVRSENTETLKGNARRPDILVTEPNVSPVVVETEVVPAVTVESDALSRLGEQLHSSGRRLLSSLAVRMPLRLRDHSGPSLKHEVATASDFEMALYTGESSTNFQRWPQSGWLRGNVVDLSILVQSASVPPAVIAAAAERLVSGVSEAAALLNEIGSTHPAAMQVIGQELRQQDGEQTRRMATTILANAFVFHESLARGPGELGEVQTLDELRGKSSGLTKSAVLKEWRKILTVNYWPIFDIARRILEVITADNADALIERLATTADELIENRLMRSHDLTGSVFQRLIADRKFLAAFYTHPASAALLVGLAIRPERTPANGLWARAEDIANLRVADFACGTGTLLSTAYRRISQLHEAAGGDAEALHPAMMANAIFGCDVLPAAAHLTASMLAGAHPTIKYDQSSILAVAYGPRADNGVALGSLDLLDPQRPLDIIAITAQAAEGMGQSEREIRSTSAHASFDLVLMNPPFTRDTNHEATRSDSPNPMFAAFDLTDAQQREMAQAAERLLRGTSAHGNAGEASAFLVLADRKLKDDGTLALVMPLSLMSGESWEASRKLLRKSYSNLVVVSIAGVHDSDLSFSADTGMGECLVVGHKLPAVEKDAALDVEKRATFVILKQRPDSQIVGSASAEQIHLAVQRGLRRLEDGPVGGTPVRFGDDVIGYALDAPLPQAGPWHLVRLADLAFAQVAHEMAANGLIWLPGIPRSSAVPVLITTVEAIGNVGPVDRDVNGNTQSGGIRGPFSVEKLAGRAAPTYPVLWSHSADRERCMEFEADSEGVVRQGANPTEVAIVQAKAATIWTTASHCHFNRDFRFNSQSTAMQFTSRRSIGGRAWPSIRLESPNKRRR